MSETVTDITSSKILNLWIGSNLDNFGRPQRIDYSDDSQRGWLTEKNYDGETASGPGNTADYTYSASGRLKTRTWERGITTSYTYDQGSLSDVEYYGTAALMQTYLSKRSLWQGLVDQENPSATEAAIADAKAAMETAGTAYTDASDPDTPSISYSYDNFGRPSTVTQAGNSNAYVYDTSTMALITETVAYDTDNNGSADFTRVLHRHQDSLLRPSGFELKNSGTTEHANSYGYDSSGRLAQVHPAVSLPADPTPSDFTYAYKSYTYGLVDTVTGPAHTVTNTYEANRNVLTNKENKAGVNIRSNFSYTVNNLGQRTNLTTSGTAFSTAPVWAWSYNGLGELVEANDTSTANNDRAFQYDGIGNREKTVNGLLGNLPATPNFTANALNQYAAIGAITPAYDLDGNATSYPMPNDQSTNAQFIWDAENRLIEVKDGTTTKAIYQYDYLGRRISKTAGSAVTRYIYDGWNIITEYAGTTLTKSYTWGMDLSGSMQGAGGVGGLIAVRIGSSDYYPTFDGNGNVSEYLDSTGAIQAHYEYDAFGNTIVSTGAKVNDFAHRFSTKPLDAETGLYYYGYRYYDPVTGRWPSRDPIGEYGGLNLYGFVGNDGVGQFDVLGEFQGDIFVLKQKMTIDADGAPTAYHPDGIGIDYLRNGGFSSNKVKATASYRRCPYGVTCKRLKNGKYQPYIQGRNGAKGPNSGYFISGTAWSNGPSNDQNSYVNSSRIPYVVVKKRKHLGKLVSVVQMDGIFPIVNHGVAADINGRTHGEASIAMAQLFGLSGSPKHGGTEKRKFCYIIYDMKTSFPGSNAGSEAEPLYQLLEKDKNGFPCDCKKN